MYSVCISLAMALIVAVNNFIQEFQTIRGDPIALYNFKLHHYREDVLLRAVKRRAGLVFHPDKNGGAHSEVYQELNQAITVSV